MAIKDFSSVLHLDPTNANAYFNRGSALDGLGKYDKAIVDYSKALELDRSVSNGVNGRPYSPRHTKVTYHIYIYI